MFDLATELPFEIKQIIFLFVLPSVKSMLTREYYNKYLTTYDIKKRIPHKNWHSFIRCVVRNDYDLIFSKLLIQNYNIWCKHAKYQYKNSTYHSYKFFIEDYAITHKSQKIRKVLFHNKNKKNETKWSKKSTLRNERWSN